jgi:hypothetical protein
MLTMATHALKKATLCSTFRTIRDMILGRFSWAAIFFL